MINVQASKASRNLVVPDDYSTINAAVNAASQGDAVLVKSGIYYENIQIDKSLTLEGEDSKNTIIIGSGGVQRGAVAVLTLAADHIQISGFTITNLNRPKSDYNNGINVEADNCAITGNIIQNTYAGIFCSIQSLTTISDNNITGNLRDGIRFDGGSLNTISKNNITENGQSGIAINGYSDTIIQNNIENNYRGIGLGSTYSVTFGNNIASNTESGIYLAGSQNIISANNNSKNKYGVFLTNQLAAPFGNKFYHNNFIENVNNAHNDYSSLVENWDDGRQSGGNYWSDYSSRFPNASEIDASGLGSIPYLINSNNTDNFPLLTPFNISNTQNLPSAIPPPTTEPSCVVAAWSFDTVDSSGITPDATGKNPAILGAVAGNESYVPTQVDGMFGKALSFNGTSYVAVPASPSLEISEEITIDAWVNVQSIKNVDYNNIIVESVRATAALPTRTLGLAINGETPQNASSPPEGVLRGYVMTRDGILNEIVTKEPVPLKQWIHIVYTRSLTSGMHISVDGVEKKVTATSGSANPTGPAITQNEIYIGHDAIIQIDEMSITNTSQPITPSLLMQWWLWVIIFASTGSGIILYLYKRSRTQKLQKNI
jgi:parallel beta-helix repeat protein